MKFSFYTLGCKVNQYETNSLKEIVLKKGHMLSDEKPDVLVINTCTVTAVSDKKNIKLIKKVKRENPTAIVAVCGCFAQISPEKAKEIEGVDIVCGTDKRLDVIDMCIDSFENSNKYVVTHDTSKKSEFEILPISKSFDRTRSLIKIQDGCNNFCSYCIIPYARGRSRSMPFDIVLEQTAELVKSGASEIIITGIEIASYGIDIDTNLLNLLNKLCSEFKSTRFRLGSLEPRIITDEFCKLLSIHKNLNPHFHLSLQSGSDSVLLRMNRKYDTERFFESCTLLRRYFKNPSITTDLIVGFPNETDAEFNETLAFIEKCQLSSMHIFPYSIREGTKASTMEIQIDGSVKSARSKASIELASKMEHTFIEGFIGQTLEIILETEDAKGMTGHSKYHFPVLCIGENLQKGHKVLVKLTETLENKAVGIVI